MYEIQNHGLKITFDRNGGGLPEKITLLDCSGEEQTILQPGGYVFELELEDGRILHPCRGSLLKNEIDGVILMEFHQVRWAVPGQEPLPKLLSSFCHELHPDGTMFTDAFFTAAGTTPPGIRRFELVIRPQFCSEDLLKWASFYRPEIADGTLIQTSSLERFMNRGEPRFYQNGIMPMVSFQTLNHGKPQIYTEFFMEGGNTVSGKKGDNESSVTWESGNPVIRWNFQKNLCCHHNLPWQWRNHWGFIVKNAPVRRHHPPMVMYHYFDNFEHYPDEECIKAMAECGCQVLAMHENWRLDVQNGGDPFDEEKFRTLIRTAHKYQIRVAPYVRGNENSVEENHAAWFRNYLQKDFDGLYMDYGGPYHLISPPDECYQDGRIHFRHHYIKLRELRRTVGCDGVFYAHTGPLFSALGLNFVDGYVSGEGEHGILLKGRPEHEYFSMSSVAFGTLWTAAFPEYGTSAILPFMAAAGQYPHSTLGVQMPSSSLAHPPVPGINDLPYRPLWKLWRTIREEKDLEVCNDFNSRGMFRQEEREDAGHNLMIGKRKALLVLSNFRKESRKIRIGTSYFDDKSDAVLLLNGRAVPWNGGEIELPGFGVAGILSGGSAGDLEEYERPYPELTEAGRRSLKEIERQKKLRENPPSWNHVGIRVRLPLRQNGAPYEESLIYDLYSGENFLYEITPDGEKKLLSGIGAIGPGRREFTLDLTKMLSPGKHSLALQCLYQGQPFYSLTEVCVFDMDAPEKNYVVEFSNALDPDRSVLSWEVMV